MENTSPKVSFVGLDDSFHKQDKSTKSSQQLQSPLPQNRLQSPIQPQKLSQTLASPESQLPSKFDPFASQTQLKSSTIGQTGASGSIRQNTSGKKYIFFSEYLKDYDPSLPKYQSPLPKEGPSRDLRDKRASVDDVRKILSPDQTGTKLIDSFREHERNREKLRLSDFDGRNTDASNILKTTENPRSDRDDLDSFGRRHSPSRLPDRLGEGSHKSNPEDVHKKVRDYRKEEIRSKLNKLSEKLYSPMKSSATAVDLHKYEKIDDNLSFDTKDYKAGRREITSSFNNPYYFIYFC